ncbi:hypothetical protein DXG01_004213 [Tephrocybe rancida]|nr:hypothetical protein DXG01_004213 [Tephrocybe rancida]
MTLLGRIAKSNGQGTALPLLENLKIPREHGDCVVLILAHPGLNLLGRYLPPSKINDLLLAEPSRIRTSTSLDATVKAEDDISVTSNEGLGEIKEEEEEEEVPIMDLATFLEFAIHATHCLENLHKLGTIHREVRANAFHLNAHSSLVRLIHFGNRAISLENYGSPSSLVLRAQEDDKLKVKEALCYLAPEQTGSIETMTQDHRTDLYSLGILFWTLLVGRGQMPFEGQPLELLHAIVQKRPMPVHELLAKTPDARYQSAHGLQKDFLECQRRLLLTISSTAKDSGELITQFEIAKEDRFMEFTLPLVMFGREQELETISNVILNASRSFSQHFANRTGVTAPQSTSSGSGSAMTEDINDALSSNSDSPNMISGDFIALSEHVTSPQGMNISPESGSSQLRKAKFQISDSAPFSALLGCLSSVLRQLMVFPTDLQRFVARLQERLGPQLQNVPLLYQGTPELQEVLASFGIFLQEPTEHLATSELRARFQSLVESVFCVIAETRLFALFLDDLHDADESSLDLVSTLVNSRSRMLIFGTIRSNQDHVFNRVQAMFASRPDPTWILLEPLSFSAISSLVSQTLHRTPEEVAPLAHYVFTASSGNAFSARSILTTLQRQHHILFDWARNHWTYDMKIIEGDANKHVTKDPTDPNYLTAHMRELSEEARKYLTWAAFFGETFKVTEVALMMDWEDSSGISSDDEIDDIWNIHMANNLTHSSDTRASMRGLQLALSEGWIIQRAREMCSWAHDRYRQAAQAEADSLPQETIAKMSLKIVLMMMLEKPVDVYRVAEHAKRCLPLLQEHPKREELLNVLMEAGESAWARGAHELATRSFLNARALLRDDPWVTNSARTFALLSRLAELFTWKGDYSTSNSILDECEAHAHCPEDVANTLRLRSRNYFFCNNFPEALTHTLLALEQLGVELNSTPSEQEVDDIFDLIKNEILAVGFDEILRMPRATDKRAELAIALLNDAGSNSYWMPSSSTFAELVGFTTIQLTLRWGMAPGTALGFFWALGAVAEKKELYRFSVDLGKLALMIAEKHGGSGEKCRAQVLFCAMVSGYDSVHIRVNIARLERAIKYGDGAGDRVMHRELATPGSFIICFLTRFKRVGELVEAAEECFNDVKIWGEAGDPALLVVGVLNCIRALGGYTNAQSPDTLFDTDSFKEKSFLEHVSMTSGSSIVLLSWYNAFKVVSFFCTGHINEAAELGFSVFAYRQGHPNHRHIRYSLFFHSLAMIACIRKGRLAEDTRTRYLSQIRENQGYIRRWLAPSPVNASTWVALVEAEMASLTKTQDVFRLYDVAVILAADNDWGLEEGWALYLSLRPAALFSEVGVQTYNDLHFAAIPAQVNQARKADSNDQENTLDASDLAAILRWSKDISSDINLSSALQRLTEIVTETSGSLNTCVVIAREVGDYTVATSMTPPGLCKVHENPKSIRAISDPLQKAIIQHTLNIKEAVQFEDASIDSRFYTEAGQTSLRSVFCVPMFSNRSQTFAAVFISSNRPFSYNIVTKLTLLYQQASISISNALLFRSVQSGTKDNLKMIATQRDALEAARKSREDALKATKIIDSILDYSKLEASAVKLEPSGFLVEGSTQTTQGYAKVGANVCLFLMNLLGNAVKFTAKGSVRVTCSVAEIRGNDEALLRFDIQDTGIGLSARDVDLLFVPFQQADNSSTRRFGGTGLGLSISRQLVKLMGGAIAVQSDLNSGSTFWFTLPVKIYNTEETRKFSQEIERTKSRLMTPSSPKILVCSTSTATLTFLSTMLSDFRVERASSTQEAKSNIERYRSSSISLDFFILDEQSEDSVTDILHCIHTPMCDAFKDTKIIHLYTPTTSSGHLLFGTKSIPGVVKMTKPPRTARIIQTLAESKQLPNAMAMSTASTQVSRAIEDLASAQRTLFGNVLIAEDNPIAQNLLIKQLERLNLHVIATDNGEEAIAEWEAHEPGYFSVALFDHHMPICDGVEATKRLRRLEIVRKYGVCLPIVALSADCQESTKQLCLSAGMNAFFTKPLKKGKP